MKKLTILLLVLISLLGRESVGLGLKNFREIFEHFRVATKLDDSSAATLRVFENEKEKLPRYGYVEELGPATLKSVVSIASVFCELRAAADQASPNNAVFFAKIDEKKDFQKVRGTVEAGIDKLALRFWGRKPTPSEKSDLLDFASQFYQESNGEVEVTTFTASLCLMVASTLDTILSR